MALSLSIFKEYCRDIGQTGSILADSKPCVNSLLKHVPFGTAKVIVEFGSASGAVTREIIRRKRPETMLLAFEINPNLYEALKIGLTGENVYLIKEDALNCERVINGVLGRRGKNVDCIVSTLPCSCINFNLLIERSVLPVLKENGSFVQYSHTLSFLKGFNLYNCLAKYFSSMVSDHVLLNIPPALVYTCKTVH